MPLAEVVLILALFLLLAVAVAGLGRRLPIPFTVLLVLIGIGLGQAAAHWPALALLKEFRLAPELVFFIFLPALIFESAYNLDARQLGRDLMPILFMAVVALLLSTSVIGLGLALAADLPWTLALLFGALISATDPVAVVALFKELGAPLRLTVLVEGESLLNDATAIVVFAILLDMAMADTSFGLANLGVAAAEFLWVFLGGALLGGLLGLVAANLAARWQLEVSAILALSLSLAYGAFIVAEHHLHVSGVMAAMSAALVLRGIGLSRLPRRAEQALEESWELVALVCNALLFLLVGLSVGLSSLFDHWALALWVVVLMLAARAVAVHGLMPFAMRRFGLPPISLGERHVMWWGGLKGGLAIAIALSIPETLPGRDLLLSLTLGVVLFTLLVNAPTVRPMLTRLGLAKLTREEQAELAVALQRGEQRATDLFDRWDHFELIPPPQQRIRVHLADTFGGTETTIPDDQVDRQLVLAAMRAEAETLEQLREIKLIDQYTYLDLRAAWRQRRDRLGSDAADDEQPQSPFVRLEQGLIQLARERNWAAAWLHRYQNKRLQRQLQRRLAELLMADAALGTLDAKVEADAVPAALRGDILARTIDARAVLAELREDFPEAYRLFVESVLQGAALTQALVDAEHRREHGELSAKAFNCFKNKLVQGMDELIDTRADPGSSSIGDLIGRVPLFDGLSEQARQNLARQAQTITFLPGDEVIAQGERGDALYIVVRGSVWVSRREADQSQTNLARLAKGDFFGEMALLESQTRTASVTAESACTLLRLTRKSVLSAAERDLEIRARLEEARQSRQESL